MQFVASSPHPEEKTLSSSSCNNNTATGVNLLATMSTFPKKESTKMRNRIPMLFGLILVIMALCAPSALAGTQVGPTLSSSTAKSETQTMLASDRGVQKFLHLSPEAAVNIKVTEAKPFKCRIGYDDRCPFNTYKDGWKLFQTSFRHGVVREAFRVTFTYHGDTRKVTFHKKSSNLLSGAKKLKRAKRVRDTAKDITMRFVVKVAATASVNVCGASASAGAKATLQTITFKVKSSHSGWTTINDKIKATASATATATAECTNGGNTPSASCVGPTNTTANNSGVPCQSASQGSTQSAAATVTPTCIGTVNNSCNTTINIYVTNTQTINQYNCAKVTQVFSDGSHSEAWYAADGSVTTEQICSSQYNTCVANSNGTQCSETPPTCQADCTPPLKCPPGSTPSTDGKYCVKNDTTPPPSGCTSNCTNPPDDNPVSAQCWWDNEGTYNNHTHASNEAVSAEDMVYAGGECPTGSSDH